VSTGQHHSSEFDAADFMAPDLILLLLRAGETSTSSGHINGITRLEKLLFLATKEQGIDKLVVDPFVFRPYHYGPYSKEVYEAVELLEEAGLVQEERFLGENQLDEAEELALDVSEELGVERRFRLTPAGEKVADLLASRTPEAFESLSSVKKTYGNLSLKRLIRYVYSRYPEFAEKSVIRESMA